ncbi:MAG: DUF3179 domain-containing protein [Bacteroidetes bacterium]|nr:DUF3179 domain-containing protein [Bacteroidota bacterium]
MIIIFLILSFTNCSRINKNKETKSIWDITGRCIKGQLKGKELMPEIHSNHFAFAWFSFHPESEIYEK